MAKHFKTTKLKYVNYVFILQNVYFSSIDVKKISAIL